VIAPDPSSTESAGPAGADAPAVSRREWHTASDEETAAVGRALGETLSPGAVIHLFGDLGAGKTVFVRGLASGLGIDPDEVSSPTFTLIQEYRQHGRHPLFHVDLYRLAGAEVDDLGLDALAAEGIVAIEWANRLPGPQPHAVVVRIEDEGDDRRRIQIDTPSS
jgi:tRNA threonylcarbamoyladenosine biosynthesis protein TsaE